MCSESLSRLFGFEEILETRAAQLFFLGDCYSLGPRRRTP